MKAKPGTVTGFIEPPKKSKGWQKGYGYFAVESDGTIFLSWAHAGASQIEVWLCAGYDGEPMMLIEETPLYRAQWLWDNFPQMRAVIGKAIQRSDAQEKGLEPFLRARQRAARNYQRGSRSPCPPDALAFWAAVLCVGCLLAFR